LTLKYKIVLAGAKNVGKSSLIARFCDNIFNESTMDTIGVAFKRKKFLLESNLTIEVSIWDFAGENDPKYRSLFPNYAHGAAAALILYDITRKETLEDIKNWIKIIDESNNDAIIKVLIGTKVDLDDQRQIHLEDARKLLSLAQTNVEIIETSSKTGENVEKAFENAVRAIVQKRIQKCEHCSEYFDIRLKFCNYCGEQSILAI